MVDKELYKLIHRALSGERIYIPIEIESIDLRELFEDSNGNLVID